MTATQMAKSEPALILKPSREKPVLRRHPWVFSGAVAEVRGKPKSGDVVDIMSASGEFLAKGAYSHHSQMISRIWAWNSGETIDRGFIRSRLESAIFNRRQLIDSGHTNAYRLVHGESDGMPGLVVDQYSDIVVIQLLSWSVEVWRDTIAELLLEITEISSVYERSDVEVRELEGLPKRVGIICGEDIVDDQEIEENGVRFLIDVKEGHKTGFYLDQRANRLRFRELAKRKDVLDCFSYSGGFTINAVIGGAVRVTMIESSGEALALARKNFALNQLDESKVDIFEADVFKQLRKFRDQNRQFDLIVLDPPKFAPTRAHVEKAARGYKDINLLAFKLLRPGGILVTFSCSGGVNIELFQKIVAGAALDAGVDAQITERLFQDLDHSVALNFPEGEYLKGLVCRVY